MSNKELDFVKDRTIGRLLTEMNSKECMLIIHNL
ncbi:unnamed protein product [Brassica oleracea]|uniref:(rape) hypothetical protein n=1 Tax=Brassica napus TaxID=3708 RepID=A0A816RAW8_BRANA|nr:unnamed protein product [Brassica napus]